MNTYQPLDGVAPWIRRCAPFVATAATAAALAAAWATAGPGNWADHHLRVMGANPQVVLPTVTITARRDAAEPRQVSMLAGDDAVRCAANSVPGPLGDGESAGNLQP